MKVSSNNNIIEYKLRNGRITRKIGLSLFFIFYLIVLYLLYFISEHKLFGEIIATFLGLIGLVLFAITAMTFFYSKKNIELLVCFQDSEETNQPELETQIVKTESRYYLGLIISLALSVIYLMLLIAAANANDHWSFG